MSNSSRWLDYGEYLTATAAVIGTIVSIFGGNSLVGTVPTTAAVAFNLLNRTRLEQRVKAGGKQQKAFKEEVMPHIDTLEKEIVNTRTFATTLVKQAVERPREETLAAKVPILEERVSAHQEVLVTLQNRVSGVDDRLHTLQSADRPTIDLRLERLERSISDIERQSLPLPDLSKEIELPSLPDSDRPPLDILSLADFGLDSMEEEELAYRDLPKAMSFAEAMPTESRREPENPPIVMPELENPPIATVSHPTQISYAEEPQLSFPANAIDSFANDLASGSIGPSAGLPKSGELETGDLWAKPSWILEHTLVGHTDWVRTLTFTPDNKYIVSGSFDRTLRIWQVSTAKAVSTLDKHSKGVFALTITPDNQILASGSWDEAIVLWNATDGSFLRELVGHKSSVRALAASQDSQYLLSGSFDRSIRCWRLSDGELIRQIDTDEPVAVMVLAPGENFIATAGDNGEIELWEMKTGSSWGRLRGNTDCICSMAVAPNGKLLAAGTVKGRILIWQIDDRGPIDGISQQIEAHSGQINACHFSPDGEQIITGSVDGKTKIWHCTNGGQFRDKPRHILRGEAGRAVMSVAVSHNGNQIAIGGADGTIQLWTKY
jgi:WD40 repeat protein